MRQALDRALPPGLDILDVVAAESGSLAERLEASEWLIEIPGAEPDQLSIAMASFLAADAITVDRMTKRGLRAIDIRGPVIALTAEGAALRAIVRTSVPTVRPDDIVAGLREHGLGQAGMALARRLNQGPLSGTGPDAEVGDPLR